MKGTTRRRFIAATAAAAGAVGLAGGFIWTHRPRRIERAARLEPPLPPDPAFPNPLRLPGEEGLFAAMEPADAFTLVAAETRHPIVPGRPARMLAYEAEQQGRTLLNPVLRARSGAALRIKFWNGLEETSIIHWHGLKLDSNNDGHPHYAVAAGATYDYTFTVANRAATYWYHPHPHRLTGKQVYRGLAGLFIVDDDEELALRQALDLEFGVTDIPLVLQDRRLDDDGELVFAPSAPERMLGHYGAAVLVNWTPRPDVQIASRIHRFRILNGSNARLYRLAFRHGERLLDYTVIGTDGGLLDRPRKVREVFLAPAERVDVLLDLRAANRGDAVTLVSLPFDAMHGQAQRAPASRPGGAAPEERAARAELPDGAEAELLRIRVRSKVGYERSVPPVLSRIEPVAESPFSPRLIVLDQARMRWRINAATYDTASIPITVRRGSVEAWDIRNVPPTMPHPMHLHGFQFRVVSRSGSPAQQRRLAITDSGLAATDLGWKDTVLVWPGETVRIVTDFSHPFLGDQVYLFHCHNLEHGDGGMMLNLKVAA